MNKMMLSVCCATVLTMGAMNVSAAPKEEMLPPPPHGDEMLPPPPPHEGMRGPRRGNPEKFEKKMADKMADDLNLTKEQREKAEKIRKDGREKVKPLFEEMKQIREKMDKLREDNMLEFEKILTPEQKAKLKEIKAERKAHHEKMMKERHEKREARKAERKK